ncbi:pilus assembly protein TadG-related protein [Vibrio furnissii]|uniref:pilus assembly protein TadG-related protein n=1 Tax=Vibrio furnissii TaxID=29494 RepID=UPI0039995256
MKAQYPRTRCDKQRGLVLAIVTIAMVVFLGIAALAIDMNHALTNRSKLQNSVDAAALAAAVLLDKGDTITNAQTAAETMLTKMAAASGNDEIDTSPEGVNVSVTFSNDPGDFSGTFVDDVDKERYVRVAVSNLSLAGFFMSVVGGDKKISASAVAGPSAGGGTCNTVPMAICADPDADDIVEPNIFGYIAGNIYQLKLGAQNTTMGSGNFQLLDYKGETTLSLSQQLAGGYEGCVDIAEDGDTPDASDDNTVTSKTGGTVGQVGIGLNTRFGDYPNGVGHGLTETLYPPDGNDDEAEITSPATGVDKTDLSAVTSALDLTVSYSGNTYLSGGGDGRRILAVPIIDCSGSETGKSNYLVKAVGCFLLLRRAPTNNSGTVPVYGEFLEECTSQNTHNDGTSTNSGSYRIVLYDDPVNKES